MNSDDDMHRQKLLFRFCFSWQFNFLIVFSLLRIFLILSANKVLQSVTKRFISADKRQLQSNNGTSLLDTKFLKHVFVQ